MVIWLYMCLLLVEMGRYLFFGQLVSEHDQQNGRQMSKVAPSGGKKNF
jgi:hypothetical protein